MVAKSAEPQPIPFARLVGSGLGMLSLAAGILHLSAASDHREHRLIFVFFIGVACLQLAWAGLVVQRPSRRLLVAGAALNAGVVGIWLVSRTSGLPLVAGARAPEALGMKDAVCGLFEVLLVAGVALLAVMPDVARRALVRADAATRAIGAIALSLMLLTVPASLAAHNHVHTPGDHVDAALAAHADGTADPAHSHATKSKSTDTSTAADNGHDHGAGQTTTAASGQTHVHDPGVAGTANAHSHDGQNDASPSGASSHSHGGGTGGGGDPAAPHVHDAAACQPTPQQQAAADKLVADTKASLARWSDHLRAMGDGYVPYPPVPAGWAQHYVNFGSLDDGRVLDPAHPESLLYAQTDEGYRPISALYILPHANSVGPDNLGCLAHWHTHPELFLSRPGENGSPPMLHVFIVPMRGGPFAHEPDPQSVRNLWTPFRVLVNPWYRDGCEGAPWLPGDPYQAIGSCKGWKDGHPEGA